MIFGWIIKKITNTSMFKKSKKFDYNDLLRNLNVPSGIKQMDKYTLHEYVKDLLDTYKILEYSKKETDELHDNEWNSWHISLILRFLQNGQELVISSPEDYFSKYIMTLSKNELKSKIAFILNTYENREGVINDAKRFLLKEYLWSPEEIGVLLYYLSIYKKD